MKKYFVIISLLVLSFVIFGANKVFAGSATVSWNANTEPDLAGYKIYYGTAPRSGACPTGGYPNVQNVGNVTTYTFNNLTNGVTYYFSVTAYDTSNNESTCSAEVSKVIPAADTTPPTISSVTASSITSSGATITWTTNENSDSQVEYGLTASYGSQTTLNTSMVVSHSQAISGLSASTLYHYRVKSKDAAGNQSNSIDYTFTTLGLPDTTPPSAINNLSASNIAQTSVNLSWTAPGDDSGTGTASSYDIRYATSPITDANWSSATQVAGEPTPQIAGTSQSYTVVGLNSATTYYFAIKTSDEVPNISSLSNVTSATTQGGTCTSFTYSDWSACQPNNTQSRTVISSLPDGCVGGEPVLIQPCTYTAPTCTSFTYSDWSACLANNTQTRTIVSQSPLNCTGGNPILSQSCVYIPTPPLCTDFIYSTWGQCQADNTQTRTIVSQLPQGCDGGNPVLSQFCAYIAPTCNTFTYSDWSACQPNNTQSRTIATQSPLGCTGGSPVLTQACAYTPPGSSGGGGGGGGGGGMVTDTTPPSRPKEFKATGADKQIALTWQNPTDSDFVRVLIVRKEGSQPSSRTDGIVVYEGNLQRYTDVNLDNNKTYYYAIYAYDAKPNYSEPIVLSAKPEAGKTTIEVSQPMVSVTVFTKLLYLGIKDDQVKKLQEFLAKNKTIYPEGTVTGYFGPLTQKAVQKFQCQYNIICSGAPFTNGYGMVGSRTRTKLNELYAGAPQTKEALIAQLQAQIKALQEQVAQLLVQINQLLQKKTQ